MEDFELRRKPPVTKEERAAKKEQARIEGEQNLAAQRKAEEAFRANFERLRAEREAREQLREQLATRGDTASAG